MSYEFTEENIENFQKQTFLKKLTKLNEFNLEANFNSDNLNNKDLDDINETLTEDLNLTDQLLLSNERNLEIGKSNLLDSEILVGNSNLNAKEKDRNKNKNDQVFNIEMKNLNKNNNISTQFSETFGETKIENVINLSEEIVFKEQKGPILFKLDTSEIDYIVVWRNIKIVILTICIISGFLFYASLPLIISFSKK